MAGYQLHPLGVGLVQSGVIQHQHPFLPMHQSLSLLPQRLRVGRLSPQQPGESVMGWGLRRCQLTPGRFTTGKALLGGHQKLSVVHSITLGRVHLPHPTSPHYPFILSLFSLHPKSSQLRNSYGSLGWISTGVAKALEWDPPTVGWWAASFGEGRPAALVLEQSGGSPSLAEAQQAELSMAVKEPPARSGIGVANWNLKTLHQFVSERFGISLSCSSCLSYLHRLGFALKRPKKRLVKADEGKRESFVAEYATMTEEARRSGVKIFFADEAHFRADAELRGKWMLKGEPALVDATSPRRGEKTCYYSAVCLEIGEVE